MFKRIYNEHLCFTDLMLNFNEHKLSTKPKYLLKTNHPSTKINLRFSKSNFISHLFMRALLGYGSLQITFFAQYVSVLSIVYLS